MYDEYEYDYDRIVDDSDELYDDEDFWSEDIYEDDEEIEWADYYHNVADELIDE